MKKNHGYYIARYEASYSSGETFGVGDNETYYKPASKVSIARSASSNRALTTGTLWNFITQGNASMASRQMYYGNSYVESDLVNSYAWDTAIFYIQAMGNENYANVNKRKPMLLNTGATGDEKCHIFDMAGNCEEYTTEYSTGTNGKTVLPCVIRGGVYADSSYYTSCRSSTFALGSFEFCSFRPLLYCKTGI